MVNFYHGDYTNITNIFENKFDHIILPGSLEHPLVEILLRYQVININMKKWLKCLQCLKNILRKI